MDLYKIAKQKQMEILKDENFEKETADKCSGSFQFGFVLGAEWMQKQPPTPEQIKAVLHLAHHSGVCSDWGDDIVNFVTENWNWEYETREDD